jgi:hypothetical protein
MEYVKFVNITVSLVMEPQKIVLSVFPQESMPQNVPVQPDNTKHRTNLVCNATSNVSNVLPLLSVLFVKETENLLMMDNVSAQPELMNPTLKTALFVTTNVKLVKDKLTNVSIVLPTELTLQSVTVQKELITLMDKFHLDNNKLVLRIYFQHKLNSF